MLKRLVRFALFEARDWLFGASAFVGVFGCLWLTDGDWNQSIVVLIGFVATYVFAIFFSERVLEKLGKGKSPGQ